MPIYQIMTPLSVSPDKVLPVGSAIELSEDEAAALVASGAIKPAPEMFGDPIVDPVDDGPIVDPVVADELPVLDPKLTVAALTVIAEAEGVTIGEGLTKAEIIAAIALKREADNAGPRQEGLE